MNNLRTLILLAAVAHIVFHLTHPTGSAVAAPNDPHFRLIAQATPINIDHVSDIVYDAERDLVYVSISGAQGVYGNSIMPVSPAGELGEPLYIGSEPNALALSSDNRYLYVALDGAGAFRRIDLQTMTAEPQWSLGVDPIHGYRRAGDMVVLRDDPHAVVIARMYGRWDHAGVAVYDDNIMRPNVTSIDDRIDVIEPGADAATIYGFNRENTEGGFRTTKVDADGIKVSAIHLNLVEVMSNDILFHDGHIYTTEGQVIDPVTPVNLGRFQLEVGNHPNTLPVVVGDHVYFLLYSSHDSRNKIQVFDPDTYRLESETTVEGFFDLYPTNGREIIAAGPGRFVIRSGEGKLFAVRYKLFEYSLFMPHVGRSLWNFMTPAVPTNAAPTRTSENR